MSLSHLRVAAMAVLVVAGPASIAGAQALGLGPRFSFVRGDLPSATPAARFFGGTLRLASSRRVVFEVAMDYRSTVSADGKTRSRETPLQGSLLLFPARSRFSPYLLGGFGLYSNTVETLGLQGQVTDSAVERKTGWHLGFGAELFVSRHAALFGDYRFRFVHFGQANPDRGSEPIHVPGLSSLQLSHRGSMWTSGVAFYF